MKNKLKSTLTSILFALLLLLGVSSQADAQNVYAFTTDNGARIYVDTDSIEWITLNETTFNVTAIFSSGIKFPLHFYKDYHDGVWKVQFRNGDITPVYQGPALQAVFDTVFRLRYN